MSLFDDVVKKAKKINPDFDENNAEDLDMMTKSFVLSQLETEHGKELYESYLLPKRSTKNSAGYDIASLEEYTLKLNQYLGYDFNTVEFAVRNGVPIAIDFCNPAPDAGVESVGAENFEWVVETAANYAIEKALAQEDGKDNLTWGDYVKRSSSKSPLQ